MAAFDDEVQNGLVTLTIVPSNWHVCNLGPDTYNLFKPDNWEEMRLYGLIEEYERDLEYDDVEWVYDHPGIVRGIADVLVEWLVGKFKEAGLTSITDASVKEVWSPRYYNFTSDGFEMEFTCNATELRALTEDFDVDVWGLEHYSSYDGFASWVPSRLKETKWRRIYDGEFRVESLLNTVMDDSWRSAVDEGLDEIHENNITVTVKDKEED